MALWGWIPLLDSERIVVPIPEYLQDVTEENSVNNPVIITSVTSQGCIIDVELFNIKSVKVSIVDGFFYVIDSLDKFHENEGLSEIVFQSIKQAYHIDVTHQGTNSLGFVDADSLDEAVKATCAAIVSSIYSDGSVKLYGNLPSASKSLEKAGLIAYGYAFINKYMLELGEDYKFYKELFDSLNRFHEVMYDRHRNDHVDTLSRNSLYLSKVSAELNQNVTIMTRAVVVMTVISLMIALSEIVVYDTGWMGGVAYTVATILLSMDVFLIMLNYSREEHIIIENSSNDEGLNLIELLVIITSIISIILGIVSVSKLSLNIIDVSVNEFLLLIMLYNIALLCSRRKM